MKITEILSWDCGIRSTSWAHLRIADETVNIISIGTIDFLRGNRLEDTSPDLWPRYIRSGLEEFAPVVDRDVTVAIEIQHQRHRGRISSANAATQYSIGLWYANNDVRFVHAMHKNEVGILSMEAVSRITGKALGDCRKKHSRMNFELYWLGKYGCLPTAKNIREREECQEIIGGMEGWKIRDVSDAFMQGIYVAKMMSG